MVEAHEDDAAESPRDGEDVQLPAAREAAGSMLRLRDVQALNRSFRRLAEVQEALLDRLDALERDARSPWNRAMPWLVGGLLGIAGAAVALFAWPDRTPPATPEVTVEVPPNPALADAVARMGADMQRMLDQRVAHDAQVEDLTRRLLEAEEQRLALLDQVGRTVPAAASGSGTAEAVPAGGEAAVEVEPTRLAVPDGPDEPALAGTDPEQRTWLGVTNMLLRADGFRDVRLQAGERIEGEPALRDVVWMEWGADGTVDALIEAARVDFRLHRMSGVLVVEFFDGWVAQGGRRTALPAGGRRSELVGVEPGAWLDHFPELEMGPEPEPGSGTAEEGSGSDAPSAAPPEGPPPAVDAEAVRLELDALLSRKGTYRYYRMSQLGEVDGRSLRMVQVNWYRNDGTLVKTIEADSAEVFLHESGTVELLLKNGAFLEGAQRQPFSGDRFRLHLPRQDLQAWREAGIPYAEAKP